MNESKIVKRGHGPKAGIKRREIWLTPELSDKLTKMKNDANVSSDAEMIRMLIDKGTTIPVISEEEKKDIKSLSGLSRALWIVLRNSRTSGFADLEKKYLELHQQLSSIITKLRNKI